MENLIWVILIISEIPSNVMWAALRPSAVGAALNFITLRRVSDIQPYSPFIMALAGVRVIELAGLAPAPFCGMILADFGAKVIRVDRTKVAMSLDTQARGKRSVAINLKTAEGVALLRKLCVQSDVVLEPYRKGQTSTSGNQWWNKYSDPLLKHQCSNIKILN